MLKTRPYTSLVLRLILALVMHSSLVGCGLLDDSSDPENNGQETECAPGFTGPDCDSCADPKFTGANCDECIDGFAGDDCDQCADPKFTGDGCDECADPAFTGDNCDQCADPLLVHPACDTYAFCDSYEITCGEWDDLENPCDEWFSAAAPDPAPDEETTTGANQGCYQYHLDAAAECADLDELCLAQHCNHAAGSQDADGLAPCTDPEISCGDGACNGDETQDDCPMDCTPCTPEGETKGVFPWTSCCEGLSSIGKSSYDAETGQCTPPLLGATWCTDCGDGFCDDPENSCNCPDDC